MLYLAASHSDAVINSAEEAVHHEQVWVALPLLLADIYLLYSSNISTSKPLMSAYLLLNPLLMGVFYDFIPSMSALVSAVLTFIALLSSYSPSIPN